MYCLKFDLHFEIVYLNFGSTGTGQYGLQKILSRNLMKILKDSHM